jgi:Kdo2-lipid IVA lauroyltransferase/acyltransferase
MDGKLWRRIVVEIKDYLAYLVFRSAVCVVQATTLDRCERFSQLLANFAGGTLRIRRSLVFSNLEKVFPDRDHNDRRRIAKGMWVHLFRMLCEIAHAPRKIHRTNWIDHYRVVGRQRFLQVMLDPRSKLLVTGHFGNFELGGYITGLFGFPSSTVARQLDNRFIHQFIVDFRSLGGQRLLNKNGSSVEIQRVLDNGGLLSILADHDAGVRGCWVNFLGSPASCHKAVAVFTLANNAPMIVCYNRRLDRMLQFQVDISGIADPEHLEPRLQDVEALTQWYCDRLSFGIRQTPSQYWWLHNRWKEPPKRLSRKNKAVEDNSAILRRKSA